MPIINVKKLKIIDEREMQKQEQKNNKGNGSYIVGMRDKSFF